MSPHQTTSFILWEPSHPLDPRIGEELLEPPDRAADPLAVANGTEEVPADALLADAQLGSNLLLGTVLEEVELDHFPLRVGEPGLDQFAEDSDEFVDVLGLVASVQRPADERQALERVRRDREDSSSLPARHRSPSPIADSYTHRRRGVTDAAHCALV